jgi:18S rRNA (guanine1575-N7)-methyltransferase
MWQKLELEYIFQSRGAKAVLQFYPENNHQTELVMTQATRAGFFGGLVIDFPHSTKAKKVFLVLMTGGAQALPKALGTGTDDTQEDQISYSNDR